MNPAFENDPLTAGSNRDGGATGDDYVLELSSAPHLAGAAEGAASPAAAGTPAVRYLTIQFECCHVYAPVYRNAAGTAYAGHCPRCLKAVRLPIGPGGTDARIFRAR